jgi:CheY-like chemotaxis protein
MEMRNFRAPPLLANPYDVGSMDTELPPVLIVEDNPDDLFLTTHQLRKAGVKNPVQSFHDCAALVEFLSGGGIAKFRRAPVLLLDLQMPLVDGFEVLRWIRAQESTKDLRVAVLTCSFRSSDEVRARDMGANEYFQKFPDRDRLAQFIQQPA